MLNCKNSLSNEHDPKFVSIPRMLHMIYRLREKYPQIYEELIEEDCFTLQAPFHQSVLCSNTTESFISHVRCHNETKSATDEQISTTTLPLDLSLNVNQEIPCERCRFAEDNCFSGDSAIFESYFNKSKDSNSVEHNTSSLSQQKIEEVGSSVAVLNAFQAVWKDTPLKFQKTNQFAVDELDELPKELTDFTLDFEKTGSPVSSRTLYNIQTSVNDVENILLKMGNNISLGKFSTNKKEVENTFENIDGCCNTNSQRPDMDNISSVKDPLLNDNDIYALSNEEESMHVPKSTFFKPGTKNHVCDDFNETSSTFLDNDTCLPISEPHGDSHPTVHEGIQNGDNSKTDTMQNRESISSVEITQSKNKEIPTRNLEDESLRDNCVKKNSAKSTKRISTSVPSSCFAKADKKNIKHTIVDRHRLKKFHENCGTTKKAFLNVKKLKHSSDQLKSLDDHGINLSPGLATKYQSIISNNPIVVLKKISSSFINKWRKRQNKYSKDSSKVFENSTQKVNIKIPVVKAKTKDNISNDSEMRSNIKCSSKAIIVRRKSTEEDMRSSAFANKGLKMKTIFAESKKRLKPNCNSIPKYKNKQSTIEFNSTLKSKKDNKVIRKNKCENREISLKSTSTATLAASKGKRPKEAKAVQHLPNLLDTILESQTKLKNTLLPEDFQETSLSKPDSPDAPRIENSVAKQILCPVSKTDNCKGNVTSIATNLEDSSLKAPILIDDVPSEASSQSNKCKNKIVTFNKNIKSNDGNNIKEVCIKEIKYDHSQLNQPGKDNQKKACISVPHITTSTKSLEKDSLTKVLKTNESKFSKMSEKPGKSAEKSDQPYSSDHIFNQNVGTISSKYSKNKTTSRKESLSEIDRMLDDAYIKNINKSSKSEQNKGEPQISEVRWILSTFGHNNTCRYSENLPSTVITALVDFREANPQKCLTPPYCNDPRIQLYLGNDTEQSKKTSSKKRKRQKSQVLNVTRSTIHLASVNERDCPSAQNSDNYNSSLAVSKNLTNFSGKPFISESIGQSLTPIWDVHDSSSNSSTNVLVKNQAEPDIFDTAFWTRKAIADAANITKETIKKLPVNNGHPLNNLQNPTSVLRDVSYDTVNQFTPIVGKVPPIVTQQKTSIPGLPVSQEYPLERQDLQHKDWDRFKTAGSDSDGKRFIREIWGRPEHCKIHTYRNLTSENVRFSRIEKENGAKGVKRKAQHFLYDDTLTKRPRVINSTFMLDDELSKNRQMFDKGICQLKAKSLDELDKIKRGYITKCITIQNCVRNTSVEKLQKMKDDVDNQLKNDLDSVVDKFNTQVKKRHEACSEEQNKILTIKAELASYDTFFDESTNISEDQARELSEVNNMIAKYRAEYCEAC